MRSGGRERGDYAGSDVPEEPHWHHELHCRGGFAAPLNKCRAKIQMAEHSPGLLNFCRHAEQARAGAKLPEGMSKARGMSAPSRSRDSNILICRSQDGGEKDRNMYMKGPAAHVHGHLVHVLRWLDPSCVCLGFDPLCVGREEKERGPPPARIPAQAARGGSHRMMAVPLQLVHGGPVFGSRCAHSDRFGLGPSAPLTPARLVLCVGALRRPRSG